MLVNAFFLSQFRYCPLLWMSHSCTKNKINRLLERYLRVTYNDKQSPFHEPLERNGSVSIHKQNLRFLATDMLKMINCITTTLARENFYLNEENRYKLRNRVLVVQSELLTLSIVGTAQKMKLSIKDFFSTSAYFFVLT